MNTTQPNFALRGAEELNSSYRVLVVKQSLSAIESVSQVLTKAGFVVDVADTTKEGLCLGGLAGYHVIVLDLTLSQADDSLLKQLRRYNNKSGILIISDKTELQTRVAALKSGADDFLLRPYSLDDLLERIRTLIQLKVVPTQKVVVVGELVIDPTIRMATRSGKSVGLTNREFELLCYLANRRGEIVARAELNERVFELNAESTSNLVDVYIGYVRKKIEPDGFPKLLHTVRGRGYVLDLPTNM